jgi:hypothetical protein
MAAGSAQSVVQTDTELSGQEGQEGGSMGTDPALALLCRAKAYASPWNDKLAA